MLELPKGITKLPESVKANVRIPLSAEKLIELVTPEAKKLVLQLFDAGYRSYTISRYTGLGSRIIQTIIRTK